MGWTWLDSKWNQRTCTTGCFRHEVSVSVRKKLSIHVQRLQKVDCESKQMQSNRQSEKTVSVQIPRVSPKLDKVYNPCRSGDILYMHIGYCQSTNSDALSAVFGLYSMVGYHI